MRYSILLIALFGGGIVYILGYNAYTLLLYLLVAFLFLVGLIVIVRGRVRDACLVVASIMLCFVVVEVYELVRSGGSSKQQDKIVFAPNPIFGWIPGAPGAFHVKKVDGKTGSVIFDVTNTIDEHLQRKTVSSDSGATVAFFGDSFTFGEGIEDSDTLPQIFADLENRKLRVLNFGITGYGPQHFLRAMETDVFRDRLQGAQLFVLQTAPWHAERTSCLHPEMLRSPRYSVEDGRAVYAGPCADGLSRIVREAIANSAAYRTLVEPAFRTLKPADIELYIAIVARAVELARQKYDVPTLILYLPFAPAYLSQSGYTDAAIMQKLRDAGAVVLDGAIDPADHPGMVLYIPGDGHPTGAMNRLRAEMLKAWFDGHAADLPKSEAKAH
ncbi:MAG: SGNH/GDSL hydrolase family protein [Methylobacteriaceae bacterium]|nr:SGNH/GDSL hydrolase family protein [Methylobacteriaceae bacterium]